MFKRELWFARKITPTNLEIIKILLARILLTLHISVENGNYTDIVSNTINW